MEKKEENFEINKVNDLAEKLKEAVENSTNKPTEEEIAEAKLKFEEASSLFATKSWNIGEAKDSRTFVDYLLHFTRNRLFWTKNGWMGVVKLTDELQAASNLLNGKKPLELGYQALEFCAYMLTMPGGVGIDTAREFESIAKQYSDVGIIVGTKVEEARLELKKIQYLQEKWAAAEQGFYLAEVEALKEVAIESDQEKPNIEGKVIEMKPRD